MKLSRWAIAIVVCTSYILMLDKAFASVGCDAVNNGVFNRTNYTPTGSGVLNTQANFEIGDKINFTVNGLNGSSFELMNGSLNTALLIQPLSIVPTSLSYTVTGSNNDTTLNTYMLIQAIPYEISVTATCIPVEKAPEQSPLTPGAEVTQSFLMNRANILLLNQPSGTSLQDRGSFYSSGFDNLLFSLGFSNKGAGSWPSSEMGSAYVFNGGQSNLLGGHRPIHIRHALSDIVRNLNQLSDGKMHGVEPQHATEVIPNRFDAWAEAYYTNFKNNFDQNHINLGQDGNAFVGYIGADYRLTERLLIGALVQMDSTKQTLDTLASNVNGTGWMSGPYLSTRLLNNLYFDFRAAGGRSSSNDLSIEATTGQFDTTRWLIIGRLSGDWRNGQWRLTPMTDVAYVEEIQQDFTTSNNTMVEGQQVMLGRVTFGPEIAYNADLARTMVQSYLSLKGVWNFDRSNNPIVNGQLMGIGSFFGPIGPGFGTFWGRLGAGMGILLPRGAVFRIGLMYDGIGYSDYKSLTGLGQLTLPLG